MPQEFFPPESRFITTDPRQNRWAVPYNFECLNARIENLLWRQKTALEGKRVLDLGSHMGTFALAALQLGAQFVHGVEAEEKLAAQADSLFQQEGVNPSTYRFEAGEVFRFLETVGTNEYDTILCFGLFYYTAEPYRLLKLMRRVARETVLLDTFTAGYAAVQGKDALDIHPHVNDAILDLPLMFVTLTQPEKSGYRLPDAFPYGKKTLSMTSFPTTRLLELWFQSLRMPFQKMDWSPYITHPCSWRDLWTPEQKQQSHWADIYASGLRVSYRLTTTPSGGATPSGGTDK